MKSKKSSPRFTGSSDNLLHNKYILYISFFFAIVTAARYLLSNNLEAICIFVIIGFLTTYFSKNMIIVLLATTIATNFIVMARNMNGNTIEGMTSDTAAAPATTDTAAAPTTTATAPAGAAAKKAVPATQAGTLPASSQNTADLSTVVPAVEALTNDKNSKKARNTTEFLSNLSPAAVNSEGNSMLDLQKGMAAGYAAQKEQAYNALASLGGGGGGAAAAAANSSNPAYLSQQTEMINNLKSIQPILDTAEKFLDKFENSSISKMFANMGSIPGMSLLTGGAGKGVSPAPVGAES
jgi:hypothetical protein